MESTNMLSLQLNKDLVAPIIEAKVKDAILQSLGGSDKIVEKIIDQVFNQRVTQDGRVYQCGSDNKFSWFDVVITNKVKDIVQQEMVEILKDQTAQIKKALEDQIKTKKGSSMIASALMSCLEGDFKHNFKLEFAAIAKLRKEY